MLTSPFPRHAVTLATLLGVLALSGCGGEKKAATQVAAKVNKEEISVHQINNVLSRGGNLPPEQMKAASRQVLERLVDQELLVQKAIEKKLDREPKAMQALEAARRDILARSYMESITAATSKPVPAEIAEFYGKRPELFAERRIYNLQEMTIAGNPAELLPKLQEQMSKAKNLGDVAAWLTSQNIPFGGNATTKAAEQLPLELLPRFHQMKDGQIGVVPSKDGVLMVQLMASRTAPMDQKAATPFIEQFLMNQKKVETSNKELKQLREQAKIEYLGEFAKTEEAPKAASAPPPATPATAAAPTPQTTGAKPATAPSTVPNAVALEKGIAGLK
jgi:EpsD family peptidyl-prolyl cis-trans isomerase